MDNDRSFGKAFLPEREIILFPQAFAKGGQ